MARLDPKSFKVFFLWLGIGLLLSPPLLSDDRLSPRSVVLALGADLAPAVRARVERLIRESAHCPVWLLSEHHALGRLRPDDLLLAIGEHPLTRRLIPREEIAGLGPEGFIVRSGLHGASPLIAADGLPAAQQPRRVGNLGVTYAAYALLSKLGFAFLHPLAPFVPGEIRIPVLPIALREAPRWRFRGVHYHTQHPIEITDMLQGWGPGGPADEVGFQASLAEWDLVLEWLVANRQNAVEWILLWAEKWKDFADSPLRLQRLRTLVERAQAFGLAVGVDVPIVFAQQHAFRLLRKQGKLEDELRQIRARIDWLMGAGFDFLSTESGTSEFTHPEPLRMLAWMNELTRHLADRYGKPAFVKIHCSSGQKIAGLADPATGQDLDFNFLPALSDPRLGALVHTVQHYALTDPAPTYGNQDFGHMHRFLTSQLGKRPVLFYPESAYWVSFDVDVPLFLPVYAYNRLLDLRLLAAEEDAAGRGASRLDGQLLFSSGWEWGYWLNDVIAARAAWDPLAGELSPGEAFRRALGQALAPLGPVAGSIASLVAEAAEAQQALLIHGRIGDEPPDDIRRQNGQAYLQGFESWDDLSALAARLHLPGVQLTQPDRLGLIELGRGGQAQAFYQAKVQPLLGELEARFGSLAAQGLTLAVQPGAPSSPILGEIQDGLRMNALRAEQIHALYAYQATRQDPRYLEKARSALRQAGQVSRRREGQYRVDPSRISAWAPNPTAYPFGYLWTARTLYYWQRDEGLAVRQPISPCYLNIINPIALAIGDGTVADLVRTLAGWFSFGNFRGCLAEPEEEPRFPAP